MRRFHGRLLSAFSLLLVISLLCGCISLLEVSQQFGNSFQSDAVLAQVPYIDPLIQTPFGVRQSTFYYDQLSTDAERTVYRAALEHFISDDTDSFYLKGSYSATQVANALRAVQYDYPQLLCAPWGQKCSYYTSSSGEALGIELYYSSQPAERAAARRELAQAASSILAQAAAYPDPYEREVFLYETLIQSTGYDYAAAVASEQVTQDAVAGLSLQNRMAHTAYGALVSGSAVCDGYAGALQLLCNYAGIDAATIVGSADWDSTSLAQSNRPDNHAWNLVRLESGSYYCDATWDDNGDAWLDPAGALVNNPDSPDGLRRLSFPTLHRYLNLSYEQMAQNHTFASGYIYPSAATGEDNYFVRQQLVFDSPSALSTYAGELAKAAAYPSELCFEIRLGFEPGNAGDTLSACFSGIGGYDFMFSSAPSNRTGCYFICLYY